MLSIRRLIRHFVACFLVLAISACGGGSGSSPAVPAPVVPVVPVTPVVPVAPVTNLTINPASITVAAGGTVDFSANSAANFSVTGGAANGSVLTTGVANATYTAPATPGVYQIVATSAADPTSKATASITVSATTGFRIGVSGSPRIAPGTSTQLTAFLNNLPVSATWAIEGACGTCSISATGLFSAGSTVASVTVRGTATASPSQSATFQLTRASEVILTLTAPAAAPLTAADMLTFNASISPEGINRDVTWTTGPGSSAGSVIAVDYFRGYLPPATPGTYSINAVSVADPSKTGTIPVVVTTAPATALTAPATVPSTMRYGHAAAALPDGRVLLVAGHPDRQSYNPLLSTDVFNPASGGFSIGPVLTVQRINPEAIALDADRVLVTGGEQDYQTARSSAEVLNLATGTTTAIANTMSALRIHHRMVKLGSGPNNGKVLVMGGFNGPVPYGVPSWLATASVDLFDPASNTFSASASSLKTARGLFTATVLADGRVLIVGGFQPSPGVGALASAEIYDPVTGVFSFTGSMTVARLGHTASRLPDGRVLIVGGDREATINSTAEIFDPASGTFSTVASPLAVTRIHHAAASLADGRVLIFGGESGESIVRGTVEVFNPATLSFSLYARMAIPRARATATAVTAGVHAGKVLVFGGGAVNTPGKAAELAP